MLVSGERYERHGIGIRELDVPWNLFIRAIRGKGLAVIGSVISIPSGRTKYDPVEGPSI